MNLAMGRGSAAGAKPMATKTKARKPTKHARGKLSAAMWSDEWGYDGEIPESAEADLRGMANDTPFRVSGADHVQLDRTEG
jgi:hypothetical protein